LALQERAERTRAAILDAAAAVFDDRGYAGATLSDIIAVANVTKGAMYFHFSSKEKIAHAIVAEQFEVWEPLEPQRVLPVLLQQAPRWAWLLRPAWPPPLPVLP